MNLLEITDEAVWNDYVNGHPYGHPLQLWGWGEAKRPDWRPVRLVLVDNGQWRAGAQVLLWPIPKTRWFVAYVPRGPVAEAGSVSAKQLMEAVAEWAKAQGALYVRIEPAWRLETLDWPGWKRAQHQLQMRQTYVVDLTLSRDELLAAMSRKHRQYSGKALRDGVVIRQLEPGVVGDMYHLYSETAARAGFGIHARDYYLNLSRSLGEFSWLYEAQFENQPVAFLWLAAAGSTAFELYGGVNATGQKMRANYALKWQAIVDAQAAGLSLYDFNGRVSEGVSQFKEGFGPQEVDWVGTWDRPLQPFLYGVWEGAWPVIKRAGRLMKGRR